MYKSLNPGAIGVKTDLAGAARLAGTHGFQGLHTSIEEIAALGVTRTQDILSGAGVQAAAFGLPVNLYGPETQFLDDLAGLPALGAVALGMGLTRTATWMPSWHDELDWDENYAFIKDRVGRTAAILANYNIRLGLEFLGPLTLLEGHKYVFIHSMGAMLELCAQIPSGNVGLLLDAYHWWTSGGSWGELEALSDAQVVDVHVNDAQAGLSREGQIDQVRALPGETGVIGIPRFLKTLAGIGYSGPVMVEPFSARVNAMTPDDAVRTTSEALGKTWQEAGL